MNRPKTFLLLICLTLLASAVVLAQGGGPGGPQNPPGPNPGGPGFDPDALITLQGEVIAFTGGFGAGPPTLTLDDAALGETDVHLGPFWFLDQAGFTVEVGDLVRVLAFPCPHCEVGYAAVSAENLGDGGSVTLRDEDGLPLWPGAGGLGRGAGLAPRGPMGPRHGFGPGGCAGGGANLDAALTVTGTVVSFTGGPGEGPPTLTLAADGGELVLAAGPYRTWVNAGFFPEEGQELEVTYAPTHADPALLVVLRVVDPATGFELILRDPETGMPGFGPGYGSGFGPHATCWRPGS